MIVVVKITGVKLTGDQRMVDKPEEVGGPMVPAIPLHLARIQADVLLSARGSLANSIDFYSWIWASGSHGGPRLFSPDPDSHHVLFLRQEGRYLHTIGDYPSYDLELPSRSIPALLEAWKSDKKVSDDLVERLVGHVIRAEFLSLSSSQIGERMHLGRATVARGFYNTRGLGDLISLVGPLFVAVQFDEICRAATNLSGRFAACRVSAQEFPGRCMALRLAQGIKIAGIDEHAELDKLQRCLDSDRFLLDSIQSGNPPPQVPSRGPLTVDQYRETLRVYASAMDPAMHQAACALAAKTAGIGSIPECTSQPSITE